MEKDSQEISTEPILVQLYPVRGVDDVANDPGKLIAKSNEAIQRSMETINGIARRLVKSIESLENSVRPDKVEVEFGLKLTADANSLIVSIGTESQFKVTLSWDSSEDRRK